MTVYYKEGLKNQNVITNQFTVKFEPLNTVKKPSLLWHYDFETLPSAVRFTLFLIGPHISGVTGQEQQTLGLLPNFQECRNALLEVTGGEEYLFQLKELCTFRKNAPDGKF